IGKLHDSTMMAKKLSLRTNFVCAAPSYLNRHLQNIDHINTTGNVTSVDFATSAQQDKTER
ncbi:hypothetical protein R0K04_20300, partial [Pseudoalteromonas sp. SIMBA_153]